MRDFIQNWWVIALRGAFAILFGILALTHPGVTIVALALLFGAYAFVDGIFAMIAGIRGTGGSTPRGIALAIGVLGLAVGAMTYAWPGVTIVALLYFIAGWSFVRGILELSAAVSLRKVIEGEWLLGLAGVASIVFGVIIALYPIAGAVALAYLIGAYAVAYGVVMVILGFRVWHFGKFVPGKLGYPFEPERRSA